MDVTKLDCFRYCRFLRHAGKIMVAFVLALIVCIWYTTMKMSIVPALHSGSAGLAALAALGSLAYSAVVLLALWSYLACFLAEPGHVPRGWHPFQDGEAAAAELEAWERLAAEQQQAMAAAARGRAHAYAREWEGEAARAAVSRPRYCRKCQAWKPPRAHHDSMTGRCVLRMDHYCIWVLNCVGLLNYKFFVLFLVYAMLGCLISAALLLRPCIGVFSERTPSVGRLIMVFMAFVFAVAFSLALAGFVIMHVRLAAVNKTTIEAYEKQPIRPWPYDRGTAQNLEEVFGRDRRYWALPLHTPSWRRLLLEEALATPPPPDELLGARAENPWLSLAEQLEGRSSGGRDVPGRAKPPWQAVGPGWRWAWGQPASEGLATEPGQQPPQAPPPLPPFSRQGPERRPSGAVAASHGWPDLLQSVDLVEALQQRGLTRAAACAFLDSSPTLELQVYTAGRFDCEGLWDAALVLADERPAPPPLAALQLSHWVLQPGVVGGRFGEHEAEPRVWRRHVLILGGDHIAPSAGFHGARRAVVLLRGSERRFWAGHFGGKFAAPCLRFVAPDGSWR